MGFGPRHLDFHPSKPWAFVSIERQNKLYVYKLDDGPALARDPSFIKETLTDPHGETEQGAGAIHVHPNGKFVYLTNRTFPGVAERRTQNVGRRREHASRSMPSTTRRGEPTLIQNIDGHGVQLRTFGIDPSGRILVAASILPVALPDGTTVGAGLTVFRMGSDGKLTFVRKYDVDVGNAQQFWSGMVTLP